MPRADYTVKWFIDNLDASTRKLSYVVDACDCDSVGGSTETLASLDYVDDGNSPATIPTLPTSISVEVVDPVETCGDPSINLGEQHFDQIFIDESTLHTCTSHQAWVLVVCTARYEVWNGVV